MQLSAVRDEIDKVRTQGVEPFGVNPAGIPAHQKYVERFHFPFVLLSDADRAVARAYHALKGNGKSIQRSVYLIRQDGTIGYAVQGLPPLHEVLAVLDG